MRWLNAIIRCWGTFNCQEEVDNPWYVLSKETFNRKNKLLKKAAKSYSNSDGSLIVRGKPNVLRI